MIAFNENKDSKGNRSTIKKEDFDVVRFKPISSFSKSDIIEKLKYYSVRAVKIFIPEENDTESQPQKEIEKEDDHITYFEKIQRISTVNSDGSGVAASALKFSWDHEYLLSSNAGDNSVVLYNVDAKEGTLEQILCLPISGEYPKDAALFPDNKHLVSLNHETNTMTFFNVDVEKGLLVMNGKEMKIAKPNCVIFHKLS